jgi:hypothetical protein
MTLGLVAAGAQREKEEPGLEEGGSLAFKLRTAPGTKTRGSTNYFILFLLEQWGGTTRCNRAKLAGDTWRGQTRAPAGIIYSPRQH